MNDGKNNEIEGSNSNIYGSSGGLFEGGLLTICSSRVGAYSRGGGGFEGGRVDETTNREIEDLQHFFHEFCHVSFI